MKPLIQVQLTSTEDLPESIESAKRQVLYVTVAVPELLKLPALYRGTEGDAESVDYLRPSLTHDSPELVEEHPGVLIKVRERDFSGRTITLAFDPDHDGVMIGDATVKLVKLIGAKGLHPENRIILQIACGMDDTAAKRLAFQQAH